MTITMNSWVKAAMTQNKLIMFLLYSKSYLTRYKQYQVLFATISSGLLTIEPNHLRSCQKIIFSSRGKMEVLPDQSLYLLVSNFSSLEFHLPPKYISRAVSQPDLPHAIYERYTKTASSGRCKNRKNLNSTYAPYTRCISCIVNIDRRSKNVNL